MARGWEDTVIRVSLFTIIVLAAVYYSGYFEVQSSFQVLLQRKLGLSLHVLQHQGQGLSEGRGSLEGLNSPEGQGRGGQISNGGRFGQEGQGSSEVQGSADRVKPDKNVNLKFPKEPSNASNTPPMQSTNPLFANISKINNQLLYEKVPPDSADVEKYFRNSTVKQWRSRFQDAIEFLIDGISICRGDSTEPYLLIMIPSVADDVSMRRSIRNTWLDATYKNHWPNIILNHTVKHFFIFGQKMDVSTNRLLLEEESRKFGDIVLADFPDSYRNLPFKIILGIKWAIKYCPRSRHLLKVDQDTIVNTPLMLYLLTQVEMTSQTQSYVIGLMTSGESEVQRSGRWAANDQRYPLPIYPRYMFGHSYVISLKAMSQILEASRTHNLIAPEDALITGILAKYAGVSRFNAPSFTYAIFNYDCDTVYNRKVSMTSVKSDKKLDTLWAKVMHHTCSNTPLS